MSDRFHSPHEIVPSGAPNSRCGPQRRSFFIQNLLRSSLRTSAQNIPISSFSANPLTYSPDVIHHSCQCNTQLEILPCIVQWSFLDYRLRPLRHGPSMQILGRDWICLYLLPKRHPCSGDQDVMQTVPLPSWTKVVNSSKQSVPSTH